MISQKYVTVSNGNESKMYLYAEIADDAKVYKKIKQVVKVIWQKVPHGGPFPG